MNTDRDFDQIARAWLDQMPDEAPDRTITAVLDAVETTPQVLRPAAVPRRIRTMNRFVSAGIAAAVLIAAGAFLVVSRPGPDVGTRSAPPTVPGSSPSLAPGAAVAGTPLDDALRSTWLSFAKENAVLQNGAGPVSLSFGTGGTTVSANNFGAGSAFSGTASATGADEVTVTLERASGGCSIGATGSYRWTLSPDRSQLTLTVVADACAKRMAAFARTWVRSLLGSTTVGAGVVDSMSPVFAVTLPDDNYASRTLDDFVEISTVDGFSLMVFKNPQTFADPCTTAGKRNAYQPGASAFIDHFRSSDAFVVGKAARLKVGGYDAIHVDVGGRVGYSGCPGRELDEYTPKACNCHFIVRQGDTDSMYLVEVGTDTYLFIVSPIHSVSEQSVIDSIRIPVELPRQ